MSHSESSKWLVPVVLGTSILGGGLISIAIALQSQGRSTELAANPASSPAASVVAAANATAAKPAIVSVNAAQPAAPKAAQPAGPIAQNSQNSQNPVDTFQTSDLPTVGTVKELIAGDLMCYMTVQDDRGVTRRIGATFEVCQQTNFLNQRVQFSYAPANVSDCESAEACGRSRSTLLVNRMEPTDAASDSSMPVDRYTMTNGKWTITVSNLQSWSGVNNTGNISYDACDNQNNCLHLQGGRMSCRNGTCAIGWENGDFFYSLESPMSEDGNSTRQAEATTLTVHQGDKVVLRADGFVLVEN